MQNFGLEFYCTQILYSLRHREIWREFLKCLALCARNKRHSARLSWRSNIYMCNSVTTTLNLKLTWTSEKIYFLLIITYHIAKQTQDDLEGGYTSMLLCDYRSVLAYRSHVFPNNVLAAELEFWKYSMCVIYLSSCKQILYFPKLQTWGRRFTPRRAAHTLESFFLWSFFDSTFPWIREFREFGREA